MFPRRYALLVRILVLGIVLWFLQMVWNLSDNVAENVNSKPEVNSRRRQMERGGFDDMHVRMSTWRKHFNRITLSFHEEW